MDTLKAAKALCDAIQMLNEKVTAQVVNIFTRKSRFPKQFYIKKGCL